MKCWDCGREGATRTYGLDMAIDTNDLYQSLRDRVKEKEEESWFDGGPRARYFCEACYEKRNKELQEMRERYACLKKRLMLERAIKMFEKQAIDIYEYQDIIEDMYEYVSENPDKFDSSHEMIAAIVLVDNAIKAKQQYKIGNYRVDFYVPEYKIVLEIDGQLHKNNLYRDNQRDLKIRETLGSDWEVVRISTKYIEQNARSLVDAMLAVKKEKQKIRSQHHGFLPDWYSDREKAKRKRSVKVGDDHLFDIGN